MSVLYIIGWVFAGVMALSVLGFTARDFVVKRMSASFELGMKLGILRGQLGRDQMNQILIDAGLNPADLPGMDAQ